jgi:hypothetical protein
VKVFFAFARKEAKLIQQGKRLKEMRFGVGLVRCSSFLNEDIGIITV